jgi:Tfp pilus assembly protein PilN
MSSISTLDAPTSALEELYQAYDAAVSELPDWKRDEAGIVLAALRNTLPPLAGYVDVSYVRKLIGVFVPGDVIGIEEAARIAGRSEERVRQWCRAGNLGRRHDGRWMMERAELEEFLAGRRTRAGRPRQIII